MKSFMAAGVQILPQPPPEKATQLQDVRRQLGTRNGWPLAHKEILHPLTGFVFNPAGYPYLYTFLTKKPGGGDRLVTDNLTMKQVSTGFHGTCSKSQIDWCMLQLYYYLCTPQIQAFLVNQKQESVSQSAIFPKKCNTLCRRACLEE